ncbi:TPA: N-acetylmuramoyl-L-alanine amidase [Citrobacter freundii]|uniref:peptidoglycan recognition protein family protein n=1 Tax=Citrobacter freundii TaxID=546 RepID=UPI0015770BEF|nr:peptidoglycan recognition family protein [Citrobacter freundii]NTX98190.1 N-acetylmuramoyl-L-alanine amidase [Citrobacter freundii]HAT7539949.1 N-acetylmuramoyl-L-alanine amidase [Citrobacter freundii]
MNNEYYKVTEELIHKGLDAISESIVEENEKKTRVREAILSDLREAGITIRTRSDWNAKKAPGTDGKDWDYSAIVIHHAGNSYSCDTDRVVKMRQAEETDIKSFKHLSYHYAIDCTGVIYEALDIREKGAHLKGENTGKIGVVFLSDFSVSGEASQHGPSRWGSLSEFAGQVKDDWDSSVDIPTDNQKKTIDALVKTLIKSFPIKQLGGHREFASLNALGRACPGTYGLQIAANLRKKYKLESPQKQ